MSIKSGVSKPDFHQSEDKSSFHGGSATQPDAAGIGARKTMATTTTAPDAYLQSGSSPPIPPRLLTIKQAASYWACGVWAIRQAISSKELTARTIGRRFLIEITSLDSFIDAKFKERAA